MTRITLAAYRLNVLVTLAAGAGMRQLALSGYHSGSRRRFAALMLAPWSVGTREAAQAGSAP